MAADMFEPLVANSRHILSAMIGAIAGHWRVQTMSHTYGHRLSWASTEATKLMRC